LIMRKKAANEILTTDVLQIEGQSEKHRIIDKFDSEIDFYTTIKAVRIQ